MGERRGVPGAASGTRRPFRPLLPAADQRCQLTAEPIDAASYDDKVFNMTVYNVLRLITVSVSVAAGLYLTPKLSALAPHREQTISVEDPRPLAAAILKLENELDEVITYEDPPYASRSDYKDVTAAVSRVADPQKPVLVPRRGKFAFSYPRAEGLSAGAQQTSTVLRGLIDAFNRTYPTGAMFGFQEAAGAYHIIPITARSRTGLLHSYDALLETTVTIADGETDGLRALQMLVSTVSVRAKRKLLVAPPR